MARVQDEVYLVTGATGNVGRHVVSKLLTVGARVRAFTRDPDAAGLPDGAEVVQGDLGDPGALEAHLDGVEAAFLLWPFTSEEAAAELAPKVAETLAAHAGRIVYLSAAAVIDEPDRFWGEVERAVEQSGIEWTHLRPSGFATNTLMWADEIRTEGVVRWPYGEAARSLIHERDIADVAVHALTEDGLVGAKPVLTGPEPVTQIEQVRLIGEAIGRPLRWEELPRERAREQLAAAFGDPGFADGALNTWAQFVTEPERVTSTVQEITGEPARPFARWAIDHAADFR